VTQLVTVHADPRLCEGHGICIELSPDVFGLGDEDVVTVTDDHPDERQWGDARAAAAALSPPSHHADPPERELAMNEYGPLTKKVIEYQDTVKRLVPSAKTPEDWAQLGEFIAVDGFERIGPFLDVQDFAQYTEMLNGWAQGTQGFDTTVRRISELSQRVYFEVEERHQIGDTKLVVNSMNVFEFDQMDKIRHLDVFLQQQPPTG
jgi:ferredoxin